MADTTSTDEEAAVTPTTTHFRTCPLCEATCGLEIDMRGDEVVRVRGDRDDVFSKGFICPKGSLLGKLHSDPDRLRTPLVRRDGELVEATWEEAFVAVAEGFGRVWAGGDRNAVAIYLGNPTAHTVAGAVYSRPLIKALGTKNVFSASTVDQMPRHVSSGLMYGSGGAMAVPDLDRTDYLLMLGANPYESNGSVCTAPDFPGRLAAIRERGGKVTVVDPRRTKTADAADEHLSIRPGSDAFWLAAIAQVLIADGIDLGAAAPLIADAESLTGAFDRFTPEAVAERCGIPAETTRRIAAELRGAPTAAVYGRIGTHTTIYGTLASWLTDVITAVTGNLDSPGGSMFAQSAAGRPPTPARGGRGFATGRWSSRVGDLPEVQGEFPTAILADEILTTGPGQIRALVTCGGNPARSCQDSNRLEQAFGSLDFMVSVDIYLNETTRHADVILPSPSPLQKPHFDFAFLGLSVRNVANYSPPIVELDSGDGEPALDEGEILARLAMIAAGGTGREDGSAIHDLLIEGAAAAAVRLEGGPVEGQDPAALIAPTEGRPPYERIIDVMVRTGPYGSSIDELEAHPHGIDYGPLQPNLSHVLRTTDGMAHLAPAALIVDLDRLAAGLDDDQAGLVLVGRRDLRSNNSWMHNVERLVSGRDRCTLHIHPDDANDLGLVDGKDAVISSRVGSLTVPIEVTDAVMAGVVSLPHGWGHNAPGARMGVAAAHAGVNSNILTDPAAIDPLSGNGQLNAIPVTVVPA
jgi:anaerobic selenocysteine-containing dehydrogenase